jgi:hypothetical protein
VLRFMVVTCRGPALCGDVECDLIDVRRLLTRPCSLPYRAAQWGWMMSYEIRAMSLGEILDMGFKLVRDHFTVLVGIAAATYLPLAVVGAVVRPSPGHPPSGVAIAAILLVYLLVLLASPIVWAAITFALGEIYLGRTASVGGAFRSGLSLSLPLVGTTLLAGIAVVLGLLLLVIPGLYLILTFTLVAQVIVLERVSGFAALRRSRILMRGNLLRAFGVLLVGGLITGVLGGVLQLVLGFIPLVGPLASGLAQAVGMTYSSAVVVLLYFDIRCRKEAFDLEHLAQLVATAGPSEPAPSV